MANSKFFTNTYTTGSGRLNFLRIDNLEDPLFTSFTFDIDFISSPLFYTINNSDYGYPTETGLTNNIEASLKEMYSQMVGNDQGYDILPLLSANFLDGHKLGFGLQQNVYTDLPLYGATEYIYMVDKRNGDGSQNDVRRDTNTIAESGGNTNAFNSYKLGDSVKEAVSESDKKWAATQNEQAAAQIAECDKILTKENKIKHDNEGNAVQGLLNDCETHTIRVDGVEIVVNGKTVKNPMMSEEEILEKVNEYKQKENEFEQLKKDIAIWVNGELSAFQNNATSLYNKNINVKRLMSTEDSTKEDESQKKDYEDLVKEWLWNGKTNNEDDTYITKSLKLYNDLETYNPLPNEYKKILKEDDSNSLLLKDKIVGSSTVRLSKIEEKFKSRIVQLGLMKEGEKIETLGLKVDVNISKDAPEWAYMIPSKIPYWTKKIGNEFNKTIVETIITNPLSYRCDVDSCFNSFDTKVYKDNHEMLGKYELALETIRSQLYGTSGNEVCDKNNPSPDSMYGQYLEAKNKHENDEYSQAEKTKAIAESTIVSIDNELSDVNGTNVETNLPVVSGVKNVDETTGSKILTVAPQTVLDMLGFISGMKKMTTEYPYVINSITGLDKAYETHYGIKDPYLGSGDNKITLTCWESLDLRVSSMFNRYFNAVYDRQYRRERVPVNMRRFNCSVYVHDIRNFVSKIRKNYENRIIELTDMYHSVIEFRFYDCEIVPEETGNIFNDISNEAPTEMKKTNFTFTYGNCVVNFVPQSEIAAH